TVNNSSCPYLSYNAVTVCGSHCPSPCFVYWDEFHTCALTALWECQKEAAAVWEMLRRESRKIKFQGSLFDLCSPSTAQSFAWTHVPNISIISIPLIMTWLNL
uniref:Uncharacterized protein n=1 Tax=Buteo japonicus TaxID=224669 RepID=A0A8C0ALR6_9AVES